MSIWSRIGDADHARRQLLHTVRSARAIAELCVGDTVMLSNRIRLVSDFRHLDPMANAAKAAVGGRGPPRST
jgi:hypothetical protein